MSSPSDVPFDLEDANDRKFRQAVNERVQYATMDSVARISEEVYTSRKRIDEATDMLKRHDDILARLSLGFTKIEKWLDGTTELGKDSTPGLIRQVQELSSSLSIGKKWIYGLLGIIATAAVTNMTVNLLNYGSIHAK